MGRSRGGRVGASVAATVATTAAAIVVAAIACKTPSSVTVHITTDIKCGDVGSTSITVGQPGQIENELPTTSTASCEDSGFIGTLVVLPSGSDDDRVGIKVVSGFQKQAEQCVPPAYDKCVVIRRALRYLPNKELHVNFEMERNCIDVPCSANETCWRSRCVSADVPDPNACASPDGCNGDVLTGGSGAGRDAGGPGVGDGGNGGDGAPTDAANDAFVPPCTDGQKGCVSGIPATCAGGTFKADNGASACPIACSVGQCVSAVDVAAGDKHTCAVLSDGAIRCWGDNGALQLGNATTGSFSRTPVDAVPALRARMLGLGGKTSCAMLTNGTISCWGANDVGQLGSALDASATAAPTTVVGPGQLEWDGGARNPLAVGKTHACAVDKTGATWCWGGGALGQLGIDAAPPRALPSQLTGFSGAAISAGAGHTCAVNGSDNLFCWGNNAEGQLGINSTGGTYAAPQQPNKGATNNAMVSAGGAHSCNMAGNQFPRCWGRNLEGQTGNPATASEPSPVQAGSTLIYGYYMSAGGRHTCLVERQSSDLAFVHLDCWGANDFGQLGVDAGASSPAPIRIESRLPGTQPDGGPNEVYRLATGSDHTCVVLTNGNVVCWGANDKGQIGSGSTAASVDVPTVVSFK